jgi:hypothetical protein
MAEDLKDMKPLEIRGKLVEALRLDLVGPGNGLGNPAEVLPQSPSRWYLTGFLVPIGAEASQRSDEAAQEDMDQPGESGGTDDDVAPERPAARQRNLPSSIGLSVLLPATAARLTVNVSWGDYRRRSETGDDWERKPRAETVTLELKDGARPRRKNVSNSNGLVVVWLSRPVGSLAEAAGAPSGSRTVSVFVVNERKPEADTKKDEAFVFQVQIEISGETEFLARPDLRSLASDEWDERVADLQYRNVGEYAVGHKVATEAVLDEGAVACCKLARTSWIPQAEVERVAPEPMKDVELSMDALANLQDGDDAWSRLGPLVTKYDAWIKGQGAEIPESPERRRDTGEELLRRANAALKRIEGGIRMLADPQCLDAFKLANKCMALQARRRQGVMEGKSQDTIKPAWRPFQLAWILMNLRSIAEPTGDERNIVDLLFFPTGGGKTEAYLGLAAFTLVLRRLRNPGIASAGLSVLMRYTLRLLTLDQLSRASTLICALELERQKNAEKLGDWPFEIGLWVGQAATPNKMGRQGDNDPHTARLRWRRFMDSSKNPSPIPLEECPWCGKKFEPNSFRLLPNANQPTQLVVRCLNRDCEFSRDTWLPIVAVDEPIYRRLPCFIIATVDKFAALPWTGQVGAFFGRVHRWDKKEGFYGPCDSSLGNKLPVERLLPPDLIIQDELHLISGPLGTMAGLYETALDELCTVERDHKTIRPKIVASTATVRRAQNQIQALFARRMVDIFPPPGPDYRNSFFARTHKPDESNARLYLGVAAQGRSPKAAMLRVYLALLGAGQKWYQELKKEGQQENAADAYMTLVGYFNSLRELGGSRRIIEDEVRSKLEKYSTRVRVGEADGPFFDRKIAYDPVELTSRVDTARVAEAKRKLRLAFSEKEHVDVAIATNMISVGLDIVRLGLMVVFGQPKTTAEYIQATSRVGRDEKRPGLVVTLLNVHKPRDRSHYERFVAYHQSFYRNVEATSVTPFSPRALDKGLSGALVGLARQGFEPMTMPLGAMEILQRRAQLDFVVKALADRAFDHSDLPIEDREQLKLRVRDRASQLIDDWAKAAREHQEVGASFQYNQHEAGGAKPLLHDYLSLEVRNLPPTHWRMKFRANRSLRDVEQEVKIVVKTLENMELDEETV